MLCVLKAVREPSLRAGRNWRSFQSNETASIPLTLTAGMNKLVVNHLDKTIVTSDGATIVQELEVMHPAAKMVVMASQMQEQEAGDGTSLVVTLTGE